jgi:hypothetical protein
MHNKHRHSSFGKTHLCFAQNSSGKTHMIHITLIRLRFRKTCMTFTTFKIHKQVGSNLKRKTKICKQEKLVKLMMNFDNECDVKLHFKTSYHYNL